MRYSMMKTYGFPQPELNADIFEPLSQKIRDSIADNGNLASESSKINDWVMHDYSNFEQTNSPPSMKNNHSQEKMLMNKLNLSKLQDSHVQKLIYNEHSEGSKDQFNYSFILAESARINKHIIKGRSDFPS